MPNYTSKLQTDISVDDPVQLDATYVPNARDRRYIDDQILATQTKLVASVLSGVTGTWPKLSASSDSLVSGDWICLTDEVDASGIPIVIKALTDNVDSAGRAYGVCNQAVSPGSRFFCITAGIVPASVTGLSTSGFAILDKTTARAVRVASLSAGDLFLGTITDGGHLTVNIAGAELTIGVGGGNATQLQGRDIDSTAPTPGQASYGKVARGDLEIAQLVRCSM